MSSWRFLREGVSVEHALTQLDFLITELGNVRGFSPGREPTLLSNKYMTWAETAETQLRSLFEDYEVSRSIQTDRYWHIRNITDSTPRPTPLVEAETWDQQRGLEDIRDQLVHYRDVTHVEADERLLLLDTNVYVHGKMFNQAAWDTLVPEKKVIILLPLVVIDELDWLKDHAEPGAGKVLRALDDTLKVGRALETTTLRDRVKMRLADEPRGHVRLAVHDDELARQASYYKSTSNGDLTLITRDRGMRVRAEAAGVDVMMLARDWERSPKDQDD
jgi:rRNA-processing protein FCF1